VSKRLFVGLELPLASRKMLVALNPHIKGLRWMPLDQLHLTMSFLGPVEAAQERTLRTALATVHVPPFFLPIRGVGTFGGERPAIVWAGTGKGHPHLFALHKHIQDALLHAGLEPDLKAFHPHITLARAKNMTRQALRPFLHRYEEAEFDLLPVTTFVLYSSILSHEGATHSVEMRRDLQSM
jgi:2'-5' RNA ligase